MPVGDAYYDVLVCATTKSYAWYPRMQSCLNAGGLALLAGLIQSNDMFCEKLYYCHYMLRDRHISTTSRAHHT